MGDVTIDDDKLEIWAGHLLEHSLGGIRPGERVMLKGEPITYPLLAVLSRRTDDGSRRLGEVAFGMNTGLDRVLTHPLYVEKVAGTLHIAIGSSYKECYGEAGSPELAEAEASGACNTSAVHIDIVADARPGGAVRKVWLDDTRLVVGDDLLWRPAD